MHRLTIKITNNNFWYDVQGEANIYGNRFLKIYPAQKYYLGPFFECSPEVMEERIKKVKDKIKEHYKVFTRSIECKD